MPVLFLVTLLFPTVIFAAPRTFEDLMGLFMNILNGGIGVAIILGLVIYFYGVATTIPTVKDKGSEQLRTYLLWGLLALFMMVSVWGILNLVRNTLFGGGAPDVGGFSESGSCEDAGCLSSE
ncbi:hypothetical protein A2765_06340 [Candidatus Kaiserbacteria bacterium RIFCSPHIGHO2_01_FULL_56_24]|uniref:Uncharacterized protein n=1 Tax=Candidatus Kaiserbacteria bacterium RIFCSPHIGHO2_01_FULL_56_24 TaxID=1798487 RepID=A0A1F6DG01_9BACT|nr:MAG: hypothetical protein A2765_06340 [Candidatus Kaiserbacteria bacterium RIFCSPHIGHO2_01_FULL_56_24]